MEKQYFQLNETDFGFGEARLLFQEKEQLLTLEVTGDSRTTELIAADSTHAFNWVLYPPRLYLRNVPYLRVAGSITIRVTEALLDDYDIALYLVEHTDVLGICTIAANQTIQFTGTTYLDGQEVRLIVAGKVQA